MVAPMDTVRPWFHWLSMPKAKDETRRRFEPPRLFSYFPVLSSMGVGLVCANWVLSGPHGESWLGLGINGALAMPVIILCSWKLLSSIKSLFLLNPFAQFCQAVNVLFFLITALAWMTAIGVVVTGRGSLVIVLQCAFVAWAFGVATGSLRGFLARMVAAGAIEIFLLHAYRANLPMEETLAVVAGLTGLFLMGFFWHRLGLQLLGGLVLAVNTIGCYVARPSVTLAAIAISALGLYAASYVALRVGPLDYGTGGPETA